MGVDIITFRSSLPSRNVRRRLLAVRAPALLSVSLLVSSCNGMMPGATAGGSCSVAGTVLPAALLGTGVGAGIGAIAGQGNANAIGYGALGGALLGTAAGLGLQQQCEQKAAQQALEQAEQTRLAAQQTGRAAAPPPPVAYQAGDTTGSIHDIEPTSGTAAADCYTYQSSATSNGQTTNTTHKACKINGQWQDTTLPS